MSVDNKKLYMEELVVAKYAAKSTRVRQLNIPERNLIDNYSIIDKNVLIIGSGAGRVPSNLLLFGNTVTAVELSPELHQVALSTYPNDLFTNLTLINGDAINLDFLEDASFDCVFFPMNGIDLAPTIKDRGKILINMSRKLKRGGVLAFSSHNISAYAFSPKVPYSNRSIQSLKHRNSYIYQDEHVIGGGHLFKGSEDYVIKHTSDITGLLFDSVLTDSRNKFERRIASKISWLRKLYFDYILYVFIKN